jgi:PAS domain S-box-containing protein
VSWNLGAARIYGYPAAEVIGRSVSILAPPGRRDESPATLRRLERGERVDPFETVRIRKDGTPVTVSLAISPIRDGAGKVVGASSIARDMTDRRRLEEQLRQAQKMDAVGQLAGGVAHDFNNLLTVILGRAEMAMAKLAAVDPLRRELDLIHKTADRAARLTHQLLAFSRKQVLQPCVLDLATLVDGMASMLTRIIGEDVRLTIEHEAARPLVYADPAQLEQVILNLAVNARDAMPRGGRLHLVTSSAELDEAWSQRHPGARSARHVRLEVRDTGCGMDATTRLHLFEPFFTTKAQGKGTGLGLSTAYGIVKQHGGHITVDSKPGRGSSFVIHLPLFEGTMGPVEPAAVRSNPHRGSETILLVEDDPEVRGLAREILETAGYTVLDASGPHDALELATRHREPIHLLLTDVVMPDMSGPTLARRLLSSRPEMTVLYISGYSGRALDEPGADLLAKPFPPDALAEAVRARLDGFRRRASV